MNLLTSFGNLLGSMALSSGRTFWVAPATAYTVNGRACTASDGNDGLTAYRALRTPNRAWALVTADVGDVIQLLPGVHSAQTTAGVATSIAANVAGVVMRGLPGGGRNSGNPMRQRTTLTIAAADQTVNVTAADIEIAHIRFLGDALNTGSANLDFSAAASRLYLHDCSVDVTAQTASTSILGFDALGAAAHVVIEHCVFHVDGAFGAMIDMTATLDSIVRDCIINLSTGTLAAAITTGAATDRCYIGRNVFNDGAGAITAGIDGTGATIANGIVIFDNRFGVGVTVPIDNFDAAEAVISENYDFGVGATDGGALITAIT